MAHDTCSFVTVINRGQLLHWISTQTSLRGFLCRFSTASSRSWTEELFDSSSSSLPINSRFMARHGVQRIFYDHGIWIHQTTRGYFGYHHPYIPLNMEGLDTWARTVFPATTGPSWATSFSL